MRVLITGSGGMLARTLCRTLQQHDVVALDRAAMDVAHADQVESVIATHRPAVVVHCAAMTAVDACETDMDKAYAVNALGSATVAASCHRHHARLIAISTDYVFAGDGDRPYHEWDATGPRTVYGSSKLAGEQAVRAHCPDHTLVRVAWLYGSGGPSFVHTMLRLGAQAGDALRVVDDQIGNPTSTLVVADLINRLLADPIPGVVHASCSGEATWFAFAREILRRAGSARAVVPCTTADYPRPAPRPANSRLDKRVLRLAGWPEPPHWSDALDRFLRDHPHG